MSAKPKCPKCGKSTLKVFGAIVRCGLSDGIRIVNGCGWSKSVSRAAIIRLATQPKTCLASVAKADEKEVAR